MWVLAPWLWLCEEPLSGEPDEPDEPVEPGELVEPGEPVELGEPVEPGEPGASLDEGLSDFGELSVAVFVVLEVAPRLSFL